MNILDYIRLATAHESGAQTSDFPVMKLALVSNFTDDLIKKTLIGMCLSEGVHPDIYQVSYKQYLFELKDPISSLRTHDARITFIFFDVNPYAENEFTADPDHGRQVLEDIAAYAEKNKGTLVVNALPAPSSIQHNRLFRESDLHAVVREFNEGLQSLALKQGNIKVLETDHIIRWIGEKYARDLRGQFAFSQPFSHEFILSLAREWMSYVRLISGKAKKCIVLDLDNVLWGGIVGETGALGITIGTEYPGNAYREFQRALLGFYERGIILAINSRNNPEDVDEVFDTNPYMILKKKHFGALAINWNDKAQNIRAIADELNIGLDSMVFFDDDPMNRDLVRKELPQVLVPDFSLPPEEYVRTLFDIDAFQTLGLTAEDKDRGKMYAAERERKVVQTSIRDMTEYLRTLDISISIYVNEQSQIPRVAQLTQKTNQFNLSTRRMTEEDVRMLIREGALVYAGDVKDKFGPYGLTILAIVKPTGKGEAELVTFLMSCRVMGRTVEQVFMKAVAADLLKRGFKILNADFIPTKKNMPSADFLSGLGAGEVSRETEGTVLYRLDMESYVNAKAAAPTSLTVQLIHPHE